MKRENDNMKKENDNAVQGIENAEQENKKPLTGYQNHVKRFEFVIRGYRSQEDRPRAEKAPI